MYSVILNNIIDSI